MAIKDFNPSCGDSAYTVGIVDLLLECVELSYRPGKWFIIFFLLLVTGLCSRHFGRMFVCSMLMLPCFVFYFILYFKVNVIWFFFVW